MKSFTYIFALILGTIYPYIKSENYTNSTSYVSKEEISIEAPTSPPKTVSEMFNERGYYKSNGFSFDEQEIINDFNGNLIYSVPLYNYQAGAILILV